MIGARVAALLLGGAGWRGLWLLAGRADGVGMATTLALAGAIALALARARHGVSARAVAFVLAGIALAGLSGIALVQIGAVVAALAWVAMPAPRWPVVVLAWLAAPVLPTLDVLVAGPVRLVSAMLTAALLRLNGIDVVRSGVALEWHGGTLLFDGPCSGVRMLWALLVLASIVAVRRALSPPRFAALLLGAVGVAIIGNALRAASLFYVEGGFVPALHGPLAHEAVGLAAFALAALAAVAPFAWGRRAA